MQEPFLSIVIVPDKRDGPAGSALDAVGAWGEAHPFDEVIFVTPPDTGGLPEASSATDLRRVAANGSGPAALWRAGVGAARGTFVTVLDRLPLPAPGDLATLAEAARLHGRADVVYGDTCDIDATGQRGPRRSADLGMEPLDRLRQAITPAHGISLRTAVARAALTSPEVAGAGALVGWAALLRIAGWGGRFRHDPRHVTPLPFPATDADPAGPLPLALCLLSAIRPRRGRQDGRADPALVALQLAGRALAAGADGTAIIEALPPDVPAPDAWAAARALLRGLREGTGHINPDWTSLWPDIAAPSEAVLTALGRRSRMPSWADLARVETERRAALSLPPGAEGILGRSLARRVGDRRVADDPPPGHGIERFIGLVPQDGAPDLSFELLSAGGGWRERLLPVLDEYLPAPTPTPAEATTVAPPPTEGVTQDHPAAPAPKGVAAGETGDWDAVFATEDPWDYDNPYEDLKYRQTLAALPGPPGRVLELACAEGHFTRRLAPIAAEVLATDVSPTAVARARRACAGMAQVTFGVLDLASDTIPQGFDVIVCSEVLYYLGFRDHVAAFADRIAAALPVGGHFVTCHARVANDEPDGQGFTWRHSFGARTIRDIFARTTGLRLVRDDVSDIYHVSVFRRVEEGSALSSGPAIRRIPVTDALPDAIRSQLAPGTAVNGETGPAIPVLCYHRVTDDPGPPALAPFRVAPSDFAAQMDWLAEAGIQPMTLAAFESVVSEGAAVSPRSVLITFDDGYRDTLRTAVPILKERGFAATVFLPVDWIGTTAGWDEGYGPAAPLMTWDEVRVAARDGIAFASHGATHTPFPALSPAALAGELQRAARRIEAETGTRPRSVAYPYGAEDEASARYTFGQGYQVAFTTRHGRWQPGTRAMEVPRLVVEAGLPLSRFAALFGR